MGEVHVTGTANPYVRCDVQEELLKTRSGFHMSPFWPMKPLVDMHRMTFGPNRLGHPKRRPCVQGPPETATLRKSHRQKQAFLQVAVSIEPPCAGRVEFQVAGTSNSGSRFTQIL